MKSRSEEEPTLVNTFCSFHCGSYPCEFQAVVAGGRVTGLKVHPEMRVNPCHKGFKNTELLYHADRIRNPMVRAGERGEGRWRDVSWDEALGVVAEKLADIKRTHGNEAILLYGYDGSHGLPDGSDGSKISIQRVFNMFGGCIVARDRGGLCSNAAMAGHRTIFGAGGPSLTQDPDCRLIVIWSSNPFETGIRHSRYSLTKAKENGAKFVVVDPVYTSTARALGAKHIPIRPGTDVALALALTNLIVEGNSFDKDYVSRHTNAPFLVDAGTGLLARSDEGEPLIWDQTTDSPMRLGAPGATPALSVDKDGRPWNGPRYKTVWQLVRENASRWTAERAESVTGVTAVEIREFASELGSSKPCKISYGGSPGMNRARHGEDAVFSIASLNAILGAVRGRFFPNRELDVGLVKMAEEIFSVKNPVKKTIPIAMIAEAILNPSAYDTDVRAAYIVFGNPVTQNPNANKTIRALKSLDFVVVEDMFMTDTAKFADVLLPASTPLERCSIYEGSDVHFRHHNDLDFLSPRALVFYRTRASSPLYDSKDDFEIACLLAGRLGFAKEFPWATSEGWIDDFIRLLKQHPSAKKNYPWLTSLDLEKLKKEGMLAVDVPRAKLIEEFPTPSGRANLYSEELLKAGLEPLPAFGDPVESGAHVHDGIEYPLVLITPNQLIRSHSSFGNIAGLDRSPVLINRSDAAARRIADGDDVEVFNERGRIRVVASVTEGVREGVLSLPNGLWLEKGSPSVLIDDQLTGRGENASFNGARVDVSRASER